MNKRILLVITTFLFLVSNLAHATYIEVVNNHISEGTSNALTIAVQNKHCSGKHLGLSNICVVTGIEDYQFHVVDNLPDEGPYTIHVYHGTWPLITGPHASCVSSQGRTVSVYRNGCR